MTDEHDMAPERPDPVGRALTVLALLLLVAVVAVGVGMVLYLRNGLDLPRTAAERDIAVYGVAVREDPDNQANHVQLATAYARAGRPELAMESIVFAREIDDNATVSLAEAEVRRLGGDLDDALALYEAAESTALKEYTRAEEEMRRKGLAFPIDKTVLIQAANGQAIVLWELEKPDGAISALERALAVAPGDASLYALLGRYLYETGDLEGAEEAYLAALRFVPDYPAAVEGLRDLEDASDE